MSARVDVAQRVKQQGPHHESRRHGHSQRAGDMQMVADLIVGEMKIAAAPPPHPPHHRNRAQQGRHDPGKQGVAEFCENIGYGKDMDGQKRI